jgi:signal transduction histidine kinase
MNLRFLPRSIGGQLLALLLLALVITQGTSLLLLTDERNRAVRAAIGLEAAGRAANVALLLEDAPEALHAAILRSADSPLVRFQLGQEPEASHDSVDAEPFTARIRTILGTPELEIRADVRALAAVRLPSVEGMPRGMRPMHEAMMAGWTEPVELTLSIRLTSGDWLNVRSLFHRPGPQWSPSDILPLLLMAAAVVLVAWITARRVVGPMRALAAGADRLGRGLDAGPLPVTGPIEVRETTEAFNRMQARLTRFVTDRTDMLAALGHDLRSPLTAMRLRLEMLDDSEDGVRLKALVDEMQEMVEATLEFARGVARSEPAVEIDLAGLVSDLVEDAAAGEEKAVMSPTQPLLATVRPTALKRALRNLIDNAIRYGEKAHVELAVRPGVAVITITDDGPA